MIKFFPIMLLAFAYAQPSFEVASVKPIAPGPKNDQSPFAEKIDAHPGSVSMRNVRIRTCIKWAYDLKNYEISGVDPMAPEHYNITAKAEESLPVSELRIMMQNLLASRFKLTLHRETKQVQAYELTVARSGSKLHPSGPDGQAEFGGEGNVGYFKQTTVAEFADFLSFPLFSPVLDKTDLKGRFDFSLDPSDPPSHDAREGFMAAVEKQLGLKFQPVKTSIQILIVDHIEKIPTEN